MWILFFLSVAFADFAPINGIKIYYEVRGPKDGVPLLMLHGGGSTIDSAFSELAPLLAKNRRLILMEEQAHGRSQGRPLAKHTFSQTAEDMAALLKDLGVEKADVLGFSNGANSSLQLTMRYPALVRKLIFVSSFTKKSGAVAGFWDMFKGDPKKCDLPPMLRDAFLKVNKRISAVDDMCMKDTHRMRTFTDTPDSELKKVKAPVLIMLGDKDVVTVEHAVELTKLIGDAQLAVIPGGHGDFFGDISTKGNDPLKTGATAGLIESFLGPR